MTLARFVGSDVHYPNEILVNSPCYGFVIYCFTVTVEMVKDISLMGFGLLFRLVISEVVRVSCLISEVVHVSFPVLSVGFV